MLIHCSSIVVVIFIQMKARDADDKTGLLITLDSFEDVVYLVEIRKKMICFLFTAMVLSTANHIMMNLCFGCRHCRDSYFH